MVSWFMIKNVVARCFFQVLQSKLRVFHIFPQVVRPNTIVTESLRLEKLLSDVPTSNPFAYNLCLLLNNAPQTCPRRYKMSIFCRTLNASNSIQHLPTSHPQVNENDRFDPTFGTVCEGIGDTTGINVAISFCEDTTIDASLLQVHQGMLLLHGKEEATRMVENLRKSL